MRYLARVALSACALIGGSLHARGAAAQAALPNRAECLDAHRNAQELKQSAKLVEAQEHLSVCSSSSCPGAIISDCGNWIAELEQTTPSMVFEIRVDGKEALDATVLVDGQPVADRAHALKVNPGRHAVRVELPPFQPREEDVVLPEGQRMRLISIEFKNERREPAPVANVPLQPVARETIRPTPGLVYPLLGLGIAGAAGFGAFTFLGKSEQNQLEDECAPHCADADLKDMKRWYTFGDISAGVGVAALLGATIVYFTRPSREVDRAAAGLAFGVGPVRGSSARSFGLNCSQAW
jgi:hypothetical protein